VGTARSLLSAFFLLFRLRFFTFGVSTGGIAWDKKRYKILKKDTKYLKKIKIPYPPPPHSTRHHTPPHSQTHDP